MQKYKTIVVDPPWKYGKWGKGSKKARYADESFNLDSAIPYETMSVWEISRLPVESLAANNCDLYLWTTQKYLPDAFSVLNAWGFKYCQILTWAKTPMGKGQGGLFCPTTEFILLGRKGKAPQKERVDTTWWSFPRAWKTHSKKPEQFLDIVETVSDVPRLELFARRKRPGWDVWGNEVESDITLGAVTNAEF